MRCTSEVTRRQCISRALEAPRQFPEALAHYEADADTYPRMDEPVFFLGRSFASLDRYARGVL
jgi:hypothetical protein